jgi:hypothetical protein
MSRLYVFADEAGDFAFKRAPNISRYFVVCTVTMTSCDIAHDLLALRRELAWRKMPLGEYFHATTDAQAVRDEVFALISQKDFSVQATVMEKQCRTCGLQRSDFINMDGIIISYLGCARLLTKAQTY